MKNTKFKNKVIEFTIPIIATATLTSTLMIYADNNSNLDYTPGNYIIIGGNTSSSNQLPNVSISGGGISYHTYQTGVQMSPFQHYKPPQWNLSNSLYNSLITSLGNLAFGVGSGLYNMDLASPGNLAGIFGEIASPQMFGQLTLPAILYAVGTYSPVLKEALVGADNISKQMVMFSSQAISSLQNAIDSLPDGQKQAVQSCISYNLTGGQYAGLSQTSVTSFLGNNSQTAFNSIVDSCMKGESIVQAFHGNPQAINSYLNQFNPRVWVSDDIAQQEQKGLMYKGANGNLDAVDTISSTASSLYSLFNPKRVAKDMLIASMPKVHYSQTAKNIVPQFVYITLPNGQKILVSLANFNQDIRAIVNIQFYNTLESMTNATNFDSWYNQYVVPMNNAVSLTGKYLTNQKALYNDWYTLYYSIKTYDYAYTHGKFPPPNDDMIFTKKDATEYDKIIINLTKSLESLYRAYFKASTYVYLLQDAQQNEEKYMAEHGMNSKPKSRSDFPANPYYPNYTSNSSNQPYYPNYHTGSSPNIPF